MRAFTVKPVIQYPKLLPHYIFAEAEWAHAHTHTHTHTHMHTCTQVHAHAHTHTTHTYTRVTSNPVYQTDMRPAVLFIQQVQKSSCQRVSSVVLCIETVHIVGICGV